MTDRRPAVDGLRALAALAVLVTHVAFFTGVTAEHWLGPLTGRLNVGVALFFALSGFLLYRPWVAARLDGVPGPDLRRYAVRRLGRILPAYWVALLVLALVLPDQVDGAFGDRWWAYWGLLQVYSTQTVLGGIGVAWSLSTELTFYVALPALAWLAAAALARRPRAVQVRVELLLLLVSVPAALALTALLAGAGPSILPNTVLGKWPWFAVGMGLAVTHAAWGGRPVVERPAAVRAFTRGGAAFALALAILLVLSYSGLLPRVALLETPGEVRLGDVLFAVVALCLLGAVVLADPERPSLPVRALAAPPVAWLGLISYGVFLWHYPVAERLQGRSPWLAGPVVLGLTLIAATASWYLVERPALRLTGRIPRRGPQPDPPPDVLASGAS